jgi:hypothetical protein
MTGRTGEFHVRPIAWQFEDDIGVGALDAHGDPSVDF